MIRIGREIQCLPYVGFFIMAFACKARPWSCRHPVVTLIYISKNRQERTFFTLLLFTETIIFMIFKSMKALGGQPLHYFRSNTCTSTGGCHRREQGISSCVCSTLDHHQGSVYGSECSRNCRSVLHMHAVHICGQLGIVCHILDIQVLHSSWDKQKIHRLYASR